MKLTWKPGEVAQGEFLIVEPPHWLAYTWDEGTLGVTTMTIDLTAEGEGTSLRLVHTGWGSGDDWDRVYNGTNEGWSEELENLRAWLEDSKAKVWA